MTAHLRRAYAATLTEPQAAPDEATLITSAAACALAGGISAMTLWRWTRDEVIPKPTIIRGRKFWNRAGFLAVLAAAGTGETVAPAPAPKVTPRARRQSVPRPVAMVEA